MPIPYLPTEIIEEIVSHLRSLQTVNGNIPNGKSISLVCRRFLPIGQALRWRRVKIDPSTISSLAQHLREFPHLAKLIRRMYYKDYDEDEEEEEEVDPFRAESLDDLLLVLSSTSSLLGIEFEARVEESSSAAFTSVMQTASALPRLELFHFKVHGRVDWTLEVASAFNTGFPALHNLAAEFPDTLIIEPGLHAIPPSIPRKKLELLIASVGSTGESDFDTPGFMSYLLKQLDPSQCILIGHPAHDLNWELLSSCPCLRDLDITVHVSDGSNPFSDLIEHLAGLRTLESIDIDANGPETEPELTFTTHIPLKQVLAAFPASLRDLKLRDLSFSDYESIPLRQLPPSLDPKPVQLSALRPDGEGDHYAFIAWKDEAEEGGEVQWYRSEVEEDDQ
ncbi:uncharacterized protein JCM6883_003716 [Sporobolomyces salmoneus]|uniref:uncharacterized protein n=1 Tax=Sporobolomyces salmoneus TaxID=183962 RepID=UPI00317B278F